MSVFRTLLDDAVTERIRGDNPVASRKSGRRGKFKPKPKDEKVIATPRQALLVARNALQMRGLNEYAIVLTSAYTGLRIGELAGVHRDQLTLDDNGEGARLHSVQQSQYIHGEFTEIDNKYDSGRGLILPPFLAELLRELLKSRPDGEWVFTGPKGAACCGAATGTPTPGIRRSRALLRGASSAGRGSGPVCAPSWALRV